MLNRLINIASDQGRLMSQTRVLSWYLRAWQIISWHLSKSQYVDLKARCSRNAGATAGHDKNLKKARMNSPEILSKASLLGSYLRHRHERDWNCLRKPTP